MSRIAFRRSHSIYAGALLFVALSLASASAHAQGASREASAQAVFEDAKKLMAKGDFAAACPKFADSQQLDPAPGTQFNLANCYEKSGQTASAWATFKSAAASYKAHNRPDWETKARERAAALEAKLSKITITVADTAEGGLDVMRDGVSVVASERGTAIPADPGPHTITASAPGKLKWTQTVTLANGDQQSISVPALENDPAATKVAVVTTGPEKTPQAQTGETPSKPAGGGQRTIGLVLVGVGAVGVAVGSITGLLAIGKNKTSTEACPNDGACTSPEAIDANKSASSLATVSTIGFIGGGLALAAGGVLFFTAPKAEPRATARLRVVPALGPGAAGMLFSGAW